MLTDAERKKTQDQLAEIRESIERGRKDWTNLEALGRCLRALGRHDEAEPHLRESLSRPDPTGRPDRWLARGAVHRLLGEDREAVHCWQAALDELHTGTIADIDRGLHVEALFLAGQLNDAVEAAADIREEKIFRAAGVELLARARLEGDPVLAEQARDWFADQVRRQREKVSATGMVSLHDWVEIAEETIAALDRDDTDEER